MMRPPMSEARRQHVHGPLRSLAAEARAIGEPSWIVGTLIAGGGVALIVGVVLVAKAVLS